jgi:cell division protein FtsW (lipid II flippase)
MDICPGSVRVLGTRAAKTSRLGMERVLLFSVISLVGFVRGVERNRAHNPKVWLSFQQLLRTLQPSEFVRCNDNGPTHTISQTPTK